jgi:hypothetical protein
VPYHDLLALAHVRHRHHPRARLPAVDNDNQIHLSAGHIDPASVKSNLRRKMRRRIEIIGQHAVDRRGFGVHVAARDDLRAVVLQRGEDVVQLHVAGGRDFHTRKRRLVLASPDANFLQIELAAQVHHGAPNLGQNPRVDDMSFESDLFAESVH